MNDLATLMRSRVESEHPDLSLLTAGSIRRGRRIRRVRYVGAGLATAAVVAGVAVGAATLPGGHAGATELRPAAGQSLDVSHPLPQPSAIGLDLSPLDAPKLVRVLPTTGGHSLGLDDLRSVGKEPGPLAGVAVPFSIRLKGWDCGAAADDKLTCTGPQRQSVEIIWRPASAYQEWIGDPDKGGTAAVLTSKPHGNWFVTLQGDSRTSTHDLHALGDAITWH